MLCMLADSYEYAIRLLSTDEDTPFTLGWGSVKISLPGTFSTHCLLHDGFGRVHIFQGSSGDFDT